MNSDKLFYVIVGIVTLAIFVGIIFFAGGSTQQKVDTSKKVEQETLLGKNYHASMDVKKAKVVLVEFSDFQCPACKSELGELSKIQTDFKDKVALVYKNFPLTSIHNYSYNAALASEAAAKQGKFWEYHDILFREQTDTANPLKEENFVAFAKELKLNEDQFKKDYASSEVKALVDEDIKLADSLSLRGTPTVFINGVQYEGNDLYGAVKKIVEGE